MGGQPKGLREVRVSRRIAPTIGLLVGLAPAMAHAQTNIDQGKSPAQIFASDCAVCHKATRGLASGKNSLMLSAFLREHYTSSREQAAALAAYVLGAGGADSPAQGRGQKPGQDRARTPGEESKPTIRQARQPAKPEEEVPVSAKPQRPTEEEVKPGDDNGAVAEPGPGRRPAAGRNDGRPTTGTRGRRKDQDTAPSREPATVIAAPATTETPGQGEGPAPTAEAPTAAQPGDGSSVPRDDIPD
jgi:hypothetical protein